MQQNASPVSSVINPQGSSGFVLACEHASNYIPPEYNNLGVPSNLWDSHIAWDLGAAEVAREMAILLDSPLVIQNVSRLVIDCNRPPMSNDAAPVMSEIHDVPGNIGLSEEEKRQRVCQYYEPFCALLSEVLEECLSQGRQPVLLTVHSFSPIYMGVKRNTDIGLIDHDDPRFAETIFARLQKNLASDMVVHRNVPYSQSHGVTHTLSVHANSRGLLHVMIEIRNNLIASRDEQFTMAQNLAVAAQEALAELTPAVANP